MLKWQTAGEVSSVMGRDSTGRAVTQKMYRCLPWPGGGAAPQNPANPASFFNIFAPSGRPDLSGLPAPVGREVVEEGIS